MDVHFELLAPNGELFAQKKILKISFAMMMRRLLCGNAVRNYSGLRKVFMGFFSLFFLWLVPDLFPLIALLWPARDSPMLLF